MVDDDAPIELKSLRRKTSNSTQKSTQYAPVSPTPTVDQSFTPAVSIDYDAIDYENKLTVDDFFPGVNNRIAKYSEKSPLVPLGRMIGDYAFSFEESHETPYKIAERVVEKRFEDRRLSPEEVHKIAVWTVKNTYKVFNKEEYQFLRNAQERIGQVDFVSTLVFSMGKGGVIWRSLANPPKPGDYRGNSALGLITELEDVGFVYSAIDTGVQLLRAHRLYREEVLETIGDVMKNGNMLREARLIGASQALPLLANAFNSTDEAGNADPIGYMRENFVEKVNMALDKDYAATVKQVRSLGKLLPGPIKKQIEKQVDMPFDKALRKLEDIVDTESSKENREKIKEAIIGTTEVQVESMQRLTEIIKGNNEFASLADEVPGYSLFRDWTKKKFNNVSRMVALGINISEMALLSVPYSSEFLQRAEIEEMMDLVLQSYVEERPTEGYIGGALAPESD